MHRRQLFSLAGGIAAASLGTGMFAGAAPRRNTVVAIRGDEFWINGAPTYPDRIWEGHKIQGLLMNSRMIQGIFDDRNPDTVTRWAYPDTGKWDAERNTREFIAAMPGWEPSTPSHPRRPRPPNLSILQRR